MKAKRHLAEDYVNGSDELRQFLEHDFRRPPAPDFVRKVAKRIDSALIAEMKSYNESLGADERTIENVEVLHERGTLAIVTGQQPGIFTGPLYTIYKALATVQLSERHSAALMRNVVPIFWVASDDHDFEEIRTVRFVDWRGHIQSLTYTFQDRAPELSAFSIPADGERLGELVQTLDEETTDHEGKEEIVAFLKSTLRREESLADWFGRLLLQLFRGTGLVIFFPHKPCARQLASEVLEAEIRSAGTTTRLINETSSKLAALGYVVQVEKKPNETHFFLYTNGRRRKVLFERNRYYVPDENISFTQREMVDICLREPERFSPNVILRTVVQGKVLPVLDYVAGPGEIAYWAQLRPVFERFGVPMARVYPRPHVVLVSGRCAKLMRKRNIELAKIGAGDCSVLLESGFGQEELSNERALTETAERILAEFDGYAAGMSAIEVSLGASAAKLKRKIGYELAKLNEKAVAARHERIDQLQSEIRELQANLCPLGKPQERVLTIWPYLMESGWALMARLLGDVDIERTDYQPIAI